MAVAGELGTVDQSGRIRVGDLHPFEVEEDQVLVDLRAPFACPAEQGAAGRIIGLGGVSEVRVDKGPIHLLADALEGRDSLIEELRRRAARNVQFAACCRLKGLRPLQGRVEVTLNGRVVEATVKIAQVPRDAIRAAGCHGWFLSCQRRTVVSSLSGADVFGPAQGSNKSTVMKQSAGTLLYRRNAEELEVLLVHPSGNYNRHKPWSIPKGEPDPDENDLEATARRERARKPAWRPGPS